MSGRQQVEINPHVQEYVVSVKENAENLVKLKFPTKIVELNNLLSSPDFTKHPSQFHQVVNIPIPDPQAISRGLNNHVSSSPVEDKVESGPTRGSKRRRVGGAAVEVVEEIKEENHSHGNGTKVLALPTGPVLANEKIVKLIDISKPYIRDLVEDSNLLKMWITFLIPKIEDGNNFGVSIQEDTLGEIRTVEAEAAAFYEQISRYYLSRGKMISKVAKYPHVDDYRRLIAELDEKEFVSLRIVLLEIRNHYAALYDLIIKNMEKIVRPRTSNAENLY